MAALLLLAAAGLAHLGFVCLALAMPRHWSEVSGRFVDVSPGRRTLRRLGFGGLLLAYGCCLVRDGASFGTVLWVVLIALAAILVALTLAFKPSWLVPMLRAGVPAEIGKT